MANCMVNPYTGKAILKDGPTAKKIRADRMGRMARGLMANAQKAPAPAPKKRGRPKKAKPAPSYADVLMSGQKKKRGRPKGSRNKSK